MREIDQTGISPNTSSRYGAAVKLFVLHTQEGGGNAQSLANYLQNPNSQVSYHYSIDNETCIDVVDTDRASWSVLDANSYTINLCYAGSSVSMSRQMWLDRYREAIRYTAKLIAQDAAKYNPLDPRVIDYRDVGRGLAGTTDHKGITVGLGIGTHTDVGPNFPWDVLIGDLEGHDVPVVKPPNMIDEMAKVATWLGGRITAGENSCPDGRGKWAQFANGYIYWTPQTGAVAIPSNIFGVWGELGFEEGPLGYPIAGHTVLPVNGEPKIGDVQAFERGVIYRKYEERGFFVTGAIGERWKREGFENSRWGWPISNEIHFEGGVYQEFEHGRITWSPDGTVGLIPQDGPDEIVPAEKH